MYAVSIRWLLFLAVLTMLVVSCGPSVNALSGPEPCQWATPPSLALVEHSGAQEIPVTDQALLVLYPLTDVAIHSGPDRGASVIDDHAIICNIYALVPDESGATINGKRSHVAQVYTTADGRLVALWNRSGWIDSNRLRPWR